MCIFTDKKENESYICYGHGGSYECRILFYDSIANSYKKVPTFKE